MYKYIFFGFWLVTNFHLSYNSFGQSIQQDSLAALYSEDLRETLPPLDNLINIALKNSLYLKYSETSVDKNKEQVILARREWYNNIAAVGNYSVGSQRYVVASANGDFQNTFLNGYRTGVNIALPLSIITSRGAKIRSAEADYRAAELQYQQTEIDLKNRVIKEYYELLTANSILKIKSMAKEDAEIQNEFSEKSFTEGTISLEDYTLISRSTSGSLTDFEVAKSDYLIKYKQFEHLLGVSLSNLKNKK